MKARLLSHFVKCMVFGAKCRCGIVGWHIIIMMLACIIEALLTLLNIQGRPL